MDIEKLIRRLRNDADAYRNGETLGRAFADQEDVLDNAATALSTLQAENEKLRDELESKEKYYEQMIDALSAADSADLAQMTACVYYKTGGLCRYGGDDPANVCVLGPCPHERTAEEVLADLARMTAERDAAVKAVKNMAEYIVCAGRVDYFLCDEISQEHHLKYQPKNDGNYDNEPCYKCIADWFLQGHEWQENC